MVELEAQQVPPRHTFQRWRRRRVRRGRLGRRAVLLPRTCELGVQHLRAVAGLCWSAGCWGAGYRGRRGARGARRLPSLSKTSNDGWSGSSRAAAKPHKVQDRHAAEISPASCGVLQPRARVGSATAPRDDGSGIAGELAAPHIQSEARKLKLTLKTDACLRPGSVPRQAPGRPRSMGRGTCPEGSRGVRKISDKLGRRARQSALALADDGGRRAAPRLRRAAELGHRRHAPPGPRAARPSQRSSSKHDFAPALLKPPGGTARPRGCPRGLSQDPGRPSPEFGVQGQPRRQDTRPISGGFSGKWRKPGTRPRRARPAHTLLYEPPRPGTRARALPPDPLFQTPPPSGREPRSHPRSLRRRTSTGRGPTTSRRCSATA